MPRFVYVWEYRVRSDAVGEFLRRYGPEGEWVRLFRTAPGYLGTQLLRSQADPHVFATVDRWETRAAFDAFRSSRAAAFEALDLECESFTESETRIGEFDAVEPA